MASQMLPLAPPQPLALARLWRALAPLGRPWMRLFGHRLNPWWQSGTLVVLSLVLLTASGVILFLFYSVADPYGTTARINAAWWGAWLRSLHRYTADLAIAAGLLHGLRMGLQGRYHGARAVAWVSGLALMATLWLCGWTGFIMAWDQAGLITARALATTIDVLPILTEPMSRLFVSTAPPARSFFFMNLFIHVALPLAMLGLLWLHTSRLARPTLLPPRALCYGTVAAVAGLAVVVPVPLLPPADPLILGGRWPVDLWYLPWLAAPAAWPAWALALGSVALAAVLVTLPWWGRPRRTPLPPSWVNEDVCTGCTTCYEDCPYNAIAMVARSKPDPRKSELVARVDPARCVSCGICAGSCAPMSVGPPGRTGREQLLALERLLALPPKLPRVLVFACMYSGGTTAAVAAVAGVEVVPLGCAATLHSNTIEAALRQGVAGVAVVTCPSRDAIHREGPKWLVERLFHGREADLKPRVDRRRVLLVPFAASEGREAAAAVSAFVQTLKELSPRKGPTPFDPDTECLSDEEPRSVMLAANLRAVQR